MLRLLRHFSLLSDSQVLMRFQVITASDTRAAPCTRPVERPWARLPRRAWVRFLWRQSVTYDVAGKLHKHLLTLSNARYLTRSVGALTAWPSTKYLFRPGGPLICPFDRP